MRDPYSATTGATAGLGATGPAAGQAGVPYAGGLGQAPADSGGGFHWGSALGGAALGGMLPGLLGGLFGGGDSGPSPQSYLQQIPGAVLPYMKPYIQAGAAQLGPLQKMYGQLATDPAGMMQQIGSKFHASPGFNFAMQQALQGAGHAAAAGGMAGSPQAQQQSQQLATQLANQQYYNWMNQMRGMMGTGLGGMQQLAGMGAGAARGMADDIAQALAAQAQARYAQQAQQAQQQGGMWGALGDIASAALPAIISAL